MIIEIRFGLQLLGINVSKVKKKKRVNYVAIIRFLLHKLFTINKLFSCRS